MIPVYEICRRAETGPIMRESEFDKRFLPNKIMELVKEYEIKYNPQEPVPTDDNMADDLFEAGKQLILDVGILCTDTSRLIKFTDEEVKESLRAAPARAFVGSGRYLKEVVSRGVEDKTLPYLVSPPSGMPVSEDLATTIAQAFAQEELIEGYWTGTIQKLGGLPVKAGTPLEIRASRFEITSAMEGFRKAGKADLPLVGGMTGLTSAARIATLSPSCFREGDCLTLSYVTEMKTDYRTLTQIESVLGHGTVNLMMDGTPILRGIAGGPEGCAIALVAQEIECFLFGVHLSGGGAVDIMTGTNTGRESAWASDLFEIAMSRNTHCLETCYHFAAAGPCTEMLLYEATAKTISAMTSGYEVLNIPNALAAGRENYLTPLEFRLSCEIAHANLGMKRQDANAVLNELLPKYESQIRNAPKGKSFTECMNLETLAPTHEWLNTYGKVKRELEEIGVAFE